MLGDWVIGVMLRFQTNGVATMSRLAASTNAANDGLAYQNKLIDRNELAMRQYNRRIDEHRMGWINLGTAAAGALALAGGAAMVYGIKGAADVQRELTSTAIALRMKHAQPLVPMAYQVSGMTAQDATTIAREMAMAATSGLNNPQYFRQAFTRIAKAADVLWMSPKHINPVEAVKEMSTLAHLFGTYQGPAFQHMLDRATQLMYVQPEALSKLISQGRMFIPAALARGVSEDDVFQQAMIAGQTGFLKGRGGAGIARVVEYLGGAATITGHLSRIQHAAMAELGLTNRRGLLKHEFEDKKGDLLLGKAIDHLEAIRRNFTPVAYGNLLTNAFLAQGGRYLEAILRPNVYEKAKQNWSVLNHLGTVDTLWHRYTNNFIYQYNNFATNFANLFKSVFGPMLPELQTLFMDMAKALGKAVNWLTAHPNVARHIGEIITALTGVAALRVGAGAIIGMSQFLGLAKSIGETTPLLVRAGILVDNFFLLGMGQKVIPILDRFGGAVLGLGMPVSEATTAIGGLRAAMLGLLPIVGELTLTSFMTHRDARANLIHQNGYAYWKYLKGRHPGTDPYSFNRAEGDMTPAQFYALYDKNTGKKRPAYFNPSHFDRGGSYFNPRRLQHHVTTHTQRLVERVHNAVREYHHRIEKTAELVVHVSHEPMKVQFELPRTMPKGTKVHLTLQSILGSHPIHPSIPRPHVVRPA